MSSIKMRSMGKISATADTIRYLTNSGDVIMIGNVNVKDQIK
jgi:lipopolysaccharide assembly outer membrane protein LptD (OstA)